MGDIFTTGGTAPVGRGAGGGMTGFGDMLDERLLRERIIWLEGPVMDENSNRIAKQLQVLAARIPSATSRCTSTPRAAPSAPEWSSTTPCS